MTNAALRGKPDAGNPHIRFDSVEIASASPTRRPVHCKRTGLSKKAAVFLCYAVALGTGMLYASQPLSLDSDLTVDVPSGSTNTYSTLAGGSYTLTKTGGGALVFETISNSTARIVVSAGALDVRTAVPPKPAALSSAWLHLDATDISTMTCVEDDGTTFVSEWRDVNGGDVYLTGSDGSQAWTGSSSARRKPFLSPSFRNGRTVMDLGAVAVRDCVQIGDRLGGTFAFSEVCSTMREVFLVVGDTEDSKRSYVDYGKPNAYACARNTPLLGTSSALGIAYAPFIRGSIESFNGLSNSSLVYSSNMLGASKCAWTLNGADVADEVTEILPDGLNLVEIRADADSGIKFDNLGMERYFYAGGLRYGEVAIFDAELSPTVREEVRAYLSARWLPIDIAGLELGEGASLVLADNVTLRVAMFKASGAATVSGGGALKIMDVDRAGEGLVMFAGNSQTVRPDVSGLLPDLAFQSGGAITVVGLAAKGGYMSVPGAFAKKGSGVLSVMDISDGVDISVEEGVFSIDPLLIADSSWLHFDASVTNSSYMTFADDNGTNVVTAWKDVRYGNGNQLYAYSESVGRAPMFRPSFANGLPVLDFGGYNVKNSTPNARGGYMRWNGTCSSIRDVFTVASDTEDLDWNYQAIVDNASSSYSEQTKRGAPFVGSYSGSGTGFIRNSRPENASARPGALIWSRIYTGTECWLDGASFTPTAAYPVGFHVLNIKTGNDSYGDAFATDRQQTYGGTMIGEFIVFTNDVASRVRSALNSGLMSKWLGGEKAIVRQVGDLSVTKGATMQVPYQTLAPTGDVTVAGTLDVGRLLLSGNASFGSAASFAGDLELATAAAIAFPSNVLENGAAAFTVKTLKLDGGTVDVSFAEGLPKVQSSEPVKLMSCSSVEGSAQFRAKSVPNGMSARVFVGDDGVYCAFSKHGLIIVCR